MKVLTIRNPWAYAIFHLGKNVENRSWKVPKDYTGPLLVHAGKNRPSDPQEMLREYLKHPPSNEKLKSAFKYGAIIGVVQLVKCRRDSTSRWADKGKGTWHWILKNPRLLKDPIYCKGMLGLWNLGPDKMKKLPRWVRKMAAEANRKR